MTGIYERIVGEIEAAHKEAEGKEPMSKTMSKSDALLLLAAYELDPQAERFKPGIDKLLDDIARLEEQERTHFILRDPDEDPERWDGLS